MVTPPPVPRRHEHDPIPSVHCRKTGARLAQDWRRAESGSSTGRVMPPLQHELANCAPTDCRCSQRFMSMFLVPAAGCLSGLRASGQSGDWLPTGAIRSSGSTGAGRRGTGTLREAAGCVAGATGDRSTRSLHGYPSFRHRAARSLDPQRRQGSHQDRASADPRGADARGRAAVGQKGCDGRCANPLSPFLRGEGQGEGRPLVRALPEGLPLVEVDRLPGVRQRSNVIDPELKVAWRAVPPSPSFTGRGSG